MAWVEKDHNDHLISTPCYVQGCRQSDQAAQSHIQPGLECFQGWGIHNLLGQSVPVTHHPLSEKLPPNIQPKPPLSHFKTIPPCPITIHPCKQSSPSCLYAPFKYWEATVRSPRSLLFSALCHFAHPPTCNCVYVALRCFRQQVSASSKSN